MLTIIAQGQAPPSPWPTLVGLLIPWLFLGFILGSVLAVIAPRKGASAALWFLIGFVPIFGLYGAFILISRTDVAVLERIRQLEERSKTQGAT